jgi:GR25 family glycosyltransferase involved in LPS biosynthesis
LLLWSAWFVTRLDGYFINLDRSKDRLASLVKQFEVIGCGDLFERFPAVDGRKDGPFDNPGENGVWACRRSHESAILQSDPETATVILEDDVELSLHFTDVVNEGTINHAIENYRDLDMFFLDCAPFFDQMPFLIRQAEELMPKRKEVDASTEHRHLTSGFAFPGARGLYAYCAAAYVVTPKGKAKLRELIESSRDSRNAIDILFRDWISAGNLNAHVSVPFVATPAPENISTIDYDHIDLSQQLSRRENILSSAVRRMLFAGDPRIDAAEVEALLHQTVQSAEYRLSMRIHDALISMPR